MTALVSDTHNDLLDDLDAFLCTVNDDADGTVDGTVALDLVDWELDLSFTGCDRVDTASPQCSTAVTPSEAHTAQPKTDNTEPTQRTMALTAKTTTKTQKRRDQNRSRKRQREELQELRVVATQLQSKLDALLLGSCTANSRIDRHGDRAARLSTTDALALAMTRKTHALHEALASKRAAQTAKQTHEFAVLTNSRLRALIDANDAVCSSLRAACSKRYASMPPLYHPRSRPTTALDMARFETLRARLDDDCKRVDAIWRGFAVFTDPSEAIAGPSRVLRDECDRVVLESVSARILPFAPDAVANAIWDLLSAGILTPLNGELKVRARMGDTLYLTIVDTIAVPSYGDTPMIGWIVMQRVTTETRTVFAWQSHTEFVGPVDSSAIEAHGDGYMVIQSLGRQSESSSLHAAPCVWQLRIRSRPEQCGRALTASELTPESFVHCTLSQMHRNINTLGQAIENTLIDASVQISVAL